ncbi:PfkB family carbohydrate kinase [Acidipropionibacterium jensenii]|nr:PfkB family carbohydrate kinase [Acidipropionibacterium jensenii]
MSAESRAGRDPSRLIHTGQALVDAVVEIPAVPRNGGNTMASSYRQYAGGAVNTLVAAARSGGRATHAGAIGQGPNARLIREVLAAQGVEISAPAVPEADSGVCIVLVEPSGERTFITTTGAERIISVDSLATSDPQPGDAVCVTGYSLVMASTRDPLLEWLSGLPAGVDVVLDPGDVMAGLPAAVHERMRALTTVWTGNLEESRALAGLVAPDAGDLTMAQTLEPCARSLPRGTVVITRDGSNGCAVLADGRLSVVPGFPMEAVDTNGAGDVHTGALLAARLSGTARLGRAAQVDTTAQASGGAQVGGTNRQGGTAQVNGADWEDAARWANAAAAISVTRRGPDTAPGIDEIRVLLES